MTPDLAEPWLVRSAPVLAAQAAGRPLVALESTIIAHGMPYPENVRTAREVEAVIRATGAEPATIALIGGRIRIGLSDDELELLARSGNAQKVSRRDLPAVLASGEPGATTVAATMICAALAGIEVFATGGIGGVHRGAQETFDISADLQELAKTSVAVVCAGAKSILDIGLTLEYLETHGVPVLSCGQDNFAAFYTRDSGFRADSWRDAARGDRRDHPAGTGRSEGARHRGQGSDAVPAGPHQGDDRWAQPGDEHRAREAQRRSRREAGAGACR
jgi:pseudouridylate synthase